MKAIRVERTGGPEVLRPAVIPDPEPGEGDALVRLEFSGVNFIDVYHRTGLYPQRVPFTPGVEGAGVVETVGAEVSGLAPGDRVAWASHPGSYAELAVVPAARLVKVPDEVDTRTAAALMLQGMTAHYLATDTFALESGHRALVHAAAGGVGLLLVQIARLRGAQVLGTVSTAEKEQLAREAGAEEVVRYTERDFRAAALEWTAGAGVDVVYDSVGRDTVDASLGSLRRRGMLVLFGNSSGPVPPVDPLRLSRGGSLFMTRPSLGDYVAGRGELETRAADLFGWVAEGELTVRVDRVLALEEAAEAHRALEGRETAGKVLLEC